MIREYVLRINTLKRIEKKWAHICKACNQDILAGDLVISRSGSHVPTKYYHSDCARRKNIL